VNQILIFSENKELIKLWSAVLSSDYQVTTINQLNSETIADAIIIDADKVDSSTGIHALFTKKTTRFLIVGSGWSEDKQVSALVHGAAGYCGEYEPPELLLQAVQCILKGDIWIQRHLVPKVIGALIEMKSQPTEIAKPIKTAESTALFNSLSNRELDVAKMIRDGENNKTIASSLNISERTVKAHLTSAFKKLNVPDRLHLALFIKEFS